jgi:hypothetical protein
MRRALVITAGLVFTAIAVDVLIPSADAIVGKPTTSTTTTTTTTTTSTTTTTCRKGNECTPDEGSVCMYDTDPAAADTGEGNATLTHPNPPPYPWAESASVTYCIDGPMTLWPPTGLSDIRNTYNDVANAAQSYCEGQTYCDNGYKKNCVSSHTCDPLCFPPTPKDGHWHGCFTFTCSKGPPVCPKK